MDNNHLLTDIEIKDFKCFKDFKANGFKRVNLIGGMNNVGKTAFMEAIFLTRLIHSEYKDFISGLLTIEHYRSQIDINIDSTLINKILQKYSPINLSNSFNDELKIEIINNKIQYTFLNIEKQLVVEYSDFGDPRLYHKYHSNFIYGNNIDKAHLIALFNGLKKKRKREVLNNLIKEFDNDLVELDFIDDEIKVFSKSNNDWLNIYDFGDGIKYFIAYICALWRFDSNVIFFDEIENGIHYTQLDRLWEIILTISKEQNVQVFATTHSKEMIESFARVSKRFEDKDISYIKMSKLDDNSIKAGIRDYDMLQDSMEENHEVRGW